MSGPALIRLLASLTDARFPPSGQPLADQLSQWLVWTDAIALSSALGGAPPAGARREPREPRADDAQDGLCTRVRTSLTNAITGDPMLVSYRRRHIARHRQIQAAPDAAPDYAAFRQCYLALQEQMDSAIGNLRTLLRALLSDRDGTAARLAAVDAVMERVLGVREYNALTAIPGLLAAHFERLRDAELAARPSAAAAEQERACSAPPATPNAADAADGSSVTDGPWLDGFRKDMQSVLFAELEIRFQPVEGLRAALREC